MTIRSLSLLSAAMLVVGGSAALAADLPTRKAPPAPMVYVQPYSWTGFYAGLNAGAVWNTGNTDIVGSSGFVGLGSVVPSSLSTNSVGFIGGGQVGYNYQINTFVLGAEADFDGTTLSKSASYTGGPVLGTTLTTQAKESLDWLGTVRARVGFLATPQLLIYGTGGFAYGGVNQQASVVANGTGYGWYGSNNSTRTGWTAGAGAEYAITNNISLKAEYLYYDLGSKTVTVAGNSAVGSFAGLNGIYGVTKTDYNGSVARVGVNYKF